MRSIDQRDCPPKPASLAGSKQRETVAEIAFVLRPQGLRLEEELHLGDEVGDAFQAPDELGEWSLDMRIAAVDPDVGLRGIEHELESPPPVDPFTRPHVVDRLFEHLTGTPWAESPRRISAV